MIFPAIFLVIVVMIRLSSAMVTQNRKFDDNQLVEAVDQTRSIFGSTSDQLPSFVSTSKIRGAPLAIPIVPHEVFYNGINKV